MARKESHHQARYGSGTATEHCAICTMYRGPDNCTKVVAPIEPYGYCKYFDRCHCTACQGKVKK